MGSFPPASFQHFSMGSALTRKGENGKQSPHREAILSTRSLNEPFHPLLSGCDGIGRLQWP